MDELGSSWMKIQKKEKGKLNKRQLGSFLSLIFPNLPKPSTPSPLAVMLGVTIDTMLLRIVTMSSLGNLRVIQEM